ncbi:MAG: response regulator transcription factor [Sphingomonadales bacterium]|nr:response regulator transcription factor [Sphingomonadales bacterium]
METVHILIVEDDAAMAVAVMEGLSQEGFAVDCAVDSMEARRYFSDKEYRVVILDRMLPGGLNGIDLARRFRSQRPSCGLLMLTALGTTGDKVEGLEAGADDYLVKPFDFDELLARIRAILRRQDGQSGPRQLQVGSLILDLQTKEARRDGKSIGLTAKEFHLLEYFMRHKGEVLSRTQLAADVWDIHFDTGTNVVDVYINFLRKKIDRDFHTKMLVTHIGQGYQLTEEANPSPAS